MSSLLKIRSERDQMSAIERRIADFILENAHLLRDYSSQQLANALRISQSSVVKFSQKLGYKGYPDLKYAIGEALGRDGRDGGSEPRRDARAADAEAHSQLAAELWQSKTRAEEETRLINSQEDIDAIVAGLDKAERVFFFGHGEDGCTAQAFANRLALLGIVTVQHTDPVLLTSSIATAAAGDVLLVFSEQGQEPALTRIARQFRQRRGKLVSVTRHTANPLRAHADLSLLISAHDSRAHVEPLLYRSAVQHLLDLIFAVLCEQGHARRARLEANLERIRHMLDP
jgi:DNA-binding MurR/RpiR family transcriptional regulator